MAERASEGCAEDGMAESAEGSPGDGEVEVWTDMRQRLSVCQREAGRGASRHSIDDSDEG